MPVQRRIYRLFENATLTRSSVFFRMRPILEEASTVNRPFFSISTPYIIKFAVCFWFAAILCVAPQGACATEESPVEMVRDIYAHFMEDQEDMPSDLDMIYPIADFELRGLIDKEMACWDAGDGICGYEFSVIVDGQDYELSDLNIQETSRTDTTLEVTASFKNFNEPKKILYLFKQVEGAWRLADIQSQGEYSWSLVKILQ